MPLMWMLGVLSADYLLALGKWRNSASSAASAGMMRHAGRGFGTHQQKRVQVFAR